MYNNNRQRFKVWKLWNVILSNQTTSTQAQVRADASQIYSLLCCEITWLNFSNCFTVKYKKKMLAILHNII